MRFYLILLAFFFFLALLSPLALAQEDHLKSMEAVTQSVRNVCQAPSDRGKYWNIDVEGSGEAKVKLKLVNPGVSGQVEFTKGEWEGVQKVLREQQADDNRNYRECVQTIAPLFIEKFISSPPDSQISIGKSNEKINKDERLSECKAMPSNILVPIEIEKGLCFSSDSNTYKSTIQLVTRNAIRYSNYTGQEFICSTGETCSFGWPGAPKFHVVSKGYPEEKVYIVGAN